MKYKEEKKIKEYLRDELRAGNGPDIRSSIYLSERFQCWGWYKDNAIFISCWVTKTDLPKIIWHELSHWAIDKLKLDIPLSYEEEICNYLEEELYLDWGFVDLRKRYKCHRCNMPTYYGTVKCRRKFCRERFKWGNEICKTSV